MATDILDIIENIDTIYSNNSSLAVLKDFERVLDEMDLYVYKNWIDGELVKGPIVERYWVTSSFMWPYDKMPDPTGGKRLLDYGCKVTYKKDVLIEPRKIESADDIRPGTKKGKLDQKPIWIVEITLPKKLVSDIFKGYMTKLRDQMGIERNQRTDASETQPVDQNATMVPPATETTPAGGVPGAV